VKIESAGREADGGPRWGTSSARGKRLPFLAIQLNIPVLAGSGLPVNKEDCELRLKRGNKKRCAKCGKNA